jgi:glyoxylase I family protein
VTTFALQRLDHVSLNVRDRPGSIAWYVETLGLDQKNEPTADDEPVFLGAFGACIALFQAASDPGPRERESAGLRHVAFALEAADFAAAREHLEERRVAFRPEEHGFASSLYIPDPDGNVIELTCYRG